MNSLQFLPVELVDYILLLLAKPDLLSLRLTDKRLSALASVFAFSSVTTIRTENSLENLKKISGSKNLAHHVKAFEYRFMGTYDTRKRSSCKIERRQTGGVGKDQFSNLACFVGVFFSVVSYVLRPIQNANFTTRAEIL